jgi:hypothetical protein
MLTWGEMTQTLYAHMNKRKKKKKRNAHLLWILPPPLPLVCVVGCDGQIANSGIKPDIKYLEGQEERNIVENNPKF